MTDDASAAPVEPDTKDWTWVLERPCAECGFDAAGVEPGDLARELRGSGPSWAAVLRRPEMRRRPAAGVWSPLEYGCHVRDVHRTMRSRVLLMLEQDVPSFPNWDQDATAVEQEYSLLDPAEVATELVERGAEAAAAYASVPEDGWQRTGRRKAGEDGAGPESPSEFTVESLGRYHLHDVVHHVWDVTITSPASEDE
jgi:hypothetical protein